MDEPAAGLDTDESVGLGDRVRRLATGGLGILLVDHDMGLVLDVCDHVVVVDFGRVIGAGKTTTLLAISGVVPAMSGRVHVLGAPVATTAAHLVARRGLAGARACGATGGVVLRWRPGALCVRTCHPDRRVPLAAPHARPQTRRPRPRPPRRRGVGRLRL